MPTIEPATPMTPASTTTERQTWRRVIPAARRIPISRTRSMTFIVSVLAMPSAAMITATIARTSKSPKTRTSASSMAPLTWSRVTTSKARQGRGLLGSPPAGRGVIAGLEGDRERVGAGHAQL